MPTVQPITDIDKVKEMLGYLRLRSPRDALLFQTGVNTILRISDLLRLQVKHVYLNGKIREYMDIKEKKTSKWNKIIITSTLAPRLKAFIERYGLEPEHYLFYPIHLGPTKPMTRAWAGHVLVKAATACGISNFNTQSMRKTHALLIYEATAKDIGLVQMMLNHSNPKTTLRYLGITQDSMDRAREFVAV